jgi:hypothetical protein
MRVSYKENAGGFVITTLIVVFPVLGNRKDVSYAILIGIAISRISPSLLNIFPQL